MTYLSHSNSRRAQEDFTVVLKFTMKIQAAVALLALPSMGLGFAPNVRPVSVSEGNGDLGEQKAPNIGTDSVMSVLDAAAVGK